MNKVKLSSILALVLILFLSLAVVSAEDFSSEFTDTQDGIIDNSNGISDYLLNNSDTIRDSDDDSLSLNASIDVCKVSDNLSNDNLNLDDSDCLNNNPVILNDSDDDSKDAVYLENPINKNGFKYKLSDSGLTETEPVIITDSSYSKYFDLSKDGSIIDGSLDDGDILYIGSLSNKILTINRQLTLLPYDENSILSNCLIRLVEGSSGTLISNLTIKNTKDRVRNYYLCGIHIINSNNNKIINLTINNTEMKCYDILMSNASHNEIINNTIITGSATAIPMTGSSYNTFRGNYIETYNTNMIYYSMYGNGDFMPLDNVEKSHDNIIANNYFTSRNGTYDSYCYAVQLMEEAGGSGTVIANNTFDNVFRAISVMTPDTLIVNNTIGNVGGEAAVYVDGDNCTVIYNNISTQKAEEDQWNPGGEVSGVFALGDNIRIINNTISTTGTNGIRSVGDSVYIFGNDIYTESSICINLTKSNAVVENNSLEGVNSSAIRIYTSKPVENTTIINNTVSSDVKAIVLQGRVNYTLVCDNTINVLDAADAIVLNKYTNRNPISPEHYAIFNNTINGVLVSMTDLSEIERNDTDNGSNTNGTEGTGNGTSEGNGTESGNGTGDGGDIDPTVPKLATAISILNTGIVQTEYLDVYLIDEKGNPVRDATVKFYFLGKEYTRTTDSEGKASLQLNASAGNYTMNISFTGNNNYSSSNISAEISLIPLVYYVNESNFHSFFDEDGDIREKYSYANLIFQGEFHNKRIVLNREAYLFGDSAVLYDSIIKIESDNVIVDGFKIINKNHGNRAQNHRFAISLDNVRNVTVINNDIDLNSFDNGYGIFVSESYRNSILNNSIVVKAKKLTFGIMLYDSGENTIQNNSLKINGTDNPHTYESNIYVDTSISIDDFDADGMTIPEVYKTYGIILFYSSSNDIGYNSINATSGLTRYYLAVKESTNSIVGIDLYYNSNLNRVHHNNVVVSAKDPYLYGLGVLGAETGKRDQFSANNSFTDNIVFVNGTYYAAGIIAGYNSINTTILRNHIICFSNNVSYGVILEGADSSIVTSNHVISRSRINYVVEGYDTDYNRISNNTLNAYGQFVGDVSLYNSKHNRITENKLSPIFREGSAESSEYPLDIDWDEVFERIGISNPFINTTSPNWPDLLQTDLTDHADVIAPHTSTFTDIGGEDNVFEDNEVPPALNDNGGNGQNGQNNQNGQNSGGNPSGGNNANGNSNSTAINDGSGDGNSGSQSNIDGSGQSADSNAADGNTVGTSSSAAVSEAANAYNLNVDEDSASARSLSFGGMNIPVLCMLFLLIFAVAAELAKRSKRNIR
ncbi:MAG: right-handed parallel beta-helix repeat-containing protein [Methanobrevibacter sp.]|nr:right-handed parallel beta-helix repeat-containing protein [Methanobrevibacter sp.]